MKNGGCPIQKKEKLETLLSSIYERKNLCQPGDTYYYTTAQRYIFSYNSMLSDYDSRIASIVEQHATSQEISALKNEKTESLNNLEAEYSANIQKEIDAINQENATLQGNIGIASAQMGVGASNAQGSIQAELVNMYADYEAYSEKLQQQQESRDALQREYDATIIKAGIDGNIMLPTVFNEGQAISPGMLMAELSAGEHAPIIRVQVDTISRGKLKRDVPVKVEVLSYAKADYGLIEGFVVSISEDAKLTNEKTGDRYFIAEVVLSEDSLTKWKDAGGELTQDMACEIHAITGTESVFKHVLKKVHLID